LHLYVRPSLSVSLSVPASVEFTKP
jgi:hypothetical protein